MNSPRQIGACIRARRKRVKLMIAQLAELAGMDPGFLTYIEHGKKLPSMGTAARLAKAFDLSLSELLAPVPKSPPSFEYEFERQLDSLLRQRSPAEKKDILFVLKKLRNSRLAEALRELVNG